MNSRSFSKHKMHEYKTIFSVRLLGLKSLENVVWLGAVYYSYSIYEIYMAAHKFPTECYPYSQLNHFVDIQRCFVLLPVLIFFSFWFEKLLCILMVTKNDFTRQNLWRNNKSVCLKSIECTRLFYARRHSRRHTMHEWMRERGMEAGERASGRVSELRLKIN